MYDHVLEQYKEIDLIVKDYELNGTLLIPYRVYFPKKKPSKPKEPTAPTLKPNPPVDEQKLRSENFDGKFTRVFNPTLGYGQKILNPEAVEERVLEAKKRFDQVEEANNFAMADYYENLERYEEEIEQFQEYIEHAQNDDGKYLGVKELRKKLEEKKRLLDHYTEEITTRKKIIQESYSEIEAELQKVEAEKAAAAPIRTRVTGKDVENMTFKTYKFAPEWSELLGEPSKPFDFMVYGDAKAGKSYFAMNLAQYLTSFGDVAYFAIEEGLSATTQKKIETTGAKDIFLHQSTTIEEVSEELESEKYKFAFIDSASALSMSAEQFQELRSHFPETSFVLIMHTTKSNEFAGEKRWKHDVQAILEVTKEGLRSTKVQCIGRFGTGEKIICW